MKKIIVIIIISVVFCSIGATLIFNHKQDNIKKTSEHKDLKVLLSEPNEDKKFNYIILNDVENNRENKATGIDFISKIHKDKKQKNPYNNVSSNEIKSGINNTYNGDNSDVMLLARLIESEAENQPYAGKIAVGSVVMNRCRINNNTVSQTIYASGQFDGVDTELFNQQPSQEDISAAKVALSGENPVPDAYYYANLELCDPDFAKESKFIVRIGNHWFFKR